MITKNRFISFSVDYAVNPITENVLNIAVRSGEHIDISPLTNKRVQPRKDSAVCHHLLIATIHPLLVFCVTRIRSIF